MSTFDTLKPDYTTLWATAVVRPAWVPQIKPIVSAILANQARYETVAAKASVPWWWISIVHWMEAGGKFTKHLHNGDPLSARTVSEPKGKPVAMPASGAFPYTWEESAIDSLSDKPGNAITNWSVEHTLYLFESYNGMGYRINHPACKSPYLWSGTNQYKAGKYIGDGIWSASAVSEQLGAAAILVGLIQAGVDVGFGLPAAITVEPVVPPISPPLTSYEIKSIQQALVDLNYKPGKPDGVWGRQTVSAVAGFQHDHDLPITDTWTPACRAALEDAIQKDRVATVSESRATASPADVKAAGVSIVSIGQTIARTGGVAIVAGIGKAVTDSDGNVSIDKANDVITRARAAKGWLDSATGLISDFAAWIYAHPILAVAAVGAAAVFYGGKIAKDAVDAYRQGRT